MKKMVFTALLLMLTVSIGSAQWEPVNHGFLKDTTTVRNMAVVGSTTFAGTDNGLLCSTDEGNYWSPSGPKLSIDRLATDGTNLLVRTRSGLLYFTSDEGKSWTYIKGPYTSAEDVTKDGLVAYYPFNGNASDASGYANNGTPYGGASLTADRFGNPSSAYLFDGSGYVLINDSPSLQLGANYTVSAWFRVDSLGPGNWMGIVSKAAASDAGNAGPRMVLGETPAGSGVVNFHGSGTNSTLYRRWYYGVLVNNGNQIQWYLNGTTDGSAGSSDASWQFSNSNPITIGGVNQSFRTMKGAVDDIRIYNRALSAAEISELYNEGGWGYGYSGGHPYQVCAIGVKGSCLFAETSYSGASGRNAESFRSTDLGATWSSSEHHDMNVTKIVTDGKELFSLHFGDSGGYIMRSTDNGASWTNVSPAKGSYAYVYDFAFDGATIFAAVDNGGSYVYRSSDYGADWNTAIDWAKHSTISAAVSLKGIATKGSNTFLYIDYLQSSLQYLSGIYWYDNALGDWIQTADQSVSGSNIVISDKAAYAGAKGVYKYNLIGSLTITLRAEDPWGLTGPSGRVELYNSAGDLVGSARANSSSMVTFAGLLADTAYWYRVYNNRTTPWGEQFWGEKTGITIRGGDTTYDTHTHNTPFLPETKVYVNSTNELLPLGAKRIVPPGTVLRVEVRITNPSYDGAEYITEGYAKLIMDHDRAEPYDSVMTSSKGSFSVGQTKTVMFYPVVPNAEGDYYLSTGAFASSSRYTSTLTDAGGWEGPAFSVATGLVGYFPFNGNATDESRNGNNGIIHGATLTTDRFGNANRAFQFNGNGNYIEVPTGTSMQTPTSLTVSAWINIDPSITGTSNCIIAKTPTAQRTEFALAASHESTPRYVRPHVMVNGVWTYFDGSTNIQPGRWYHVVMTFDGSSLKSYINGTNDGSWAVSGQLTDANGTLIIGGYVPPSTPYWFQGTIDDIRIYNRALTAAETDALYHEGGYPPAGLPPWKLVNTGISHTIIIPTASNPNINGTALAAGDFVGVFYDSSGTLACAGYERWTGTANIAVSAFGDDPTSGVKDGFSAGEIFRWKIFRASEGSVYDAQATYTAIGGVVTHTNVYATNGISQLTSLVGGITTYCMNLRSGWSLISSYVTPQKTSLDSIFKGVLSDVIIVKNGAQKTYIPSVPVNSIGSWVNTEGYQIKMANSRSLCFTGQKIIPQALSIGLPLGWSIMPYVRDSDMPIASALSGVVGDIVLVKDQDAKTYIPSVGVNGISTLKVGQAYHIKMGNAHTIEYPAYSGVATSIADKANSTHSPTKTASVPPWFFSNTGVSHTIIIATSVNPAIDGTPLVAGDYVGVFYDSSGTQACAGYEGWSGTSPVAVSAFGDDPTTPAKDGLATGELLRWKIWRQSDGHVVVAVATYLPPGGLGGIVSDTSTYNTNGISAISTLTGSLVSVNGEEVPTEFTLKQNYPNPFNPSTTIRFGLPNRSHVTLTVFNTLGQQVSILQNGEQEAGYHEVKFEGSGLSSGVYFYRIQVRPADSAIGRDSKSGAGDFVATRRLLLLR